MTTSFGNLDVEKATRKTAVILEALGSDVPLAKGADRALVGETPVFHPQIHGHHGFGNANLPDLRSRTWCTSPAPKSPSGWSTSTRDS